MSDNIEKLARGNVLRSEYIDRDIKSLKGGLTPIVFSWTHIVGLASKKNETRFLGKLIDKKCTLTTIYLCYELSSECFAMRPVREQLSQQLARLRYFSIFQLYLRYGKPFKGVTNQSCKPHFISQCILTLVLLKNFISYFQQLY